MVKVHAGEPLLQQSLMARATERASEWAHMSPLRMRVILVALVRRIEVDPDQVIIHFRPRRLAALLGDRLTAAHSLTSQSLPLTHPVQLRRAGKKCEW